MQSWKALGIPLQDQDFGKLEVLITRKLISAVEWCSQIPACGEDLIPEILSLERFSVKDKCAGKACYM